MTANRPATEPRTEAGRRLAEADWMRQVMEFAQLMGWETFHPRPARTLDGWRTPGSGSMAKGWPDLVLVRDGRLIFAELKTDTGRLTASQDRVGGILNEVAEYHVWRPSDWEWVQAALERRRNAA